MRSLFFCLIILFTSCRTTPELLTGKVVKIKDGDSIEVLTAGKELVEVRLAHIDCPERYQPFSRQARQFTSDFCFGKTVSLEETDRDRYGRRVCFVWVDDQELNLALLEAGLAWHYTRYSSDRDYARAEERARRLKLGLWSDRDAVPPWEWRNTRRENQ